MSDSTLKQIKPWVKTFSAEIPIKYKHGDVVCIGGIIKSIIDLRGLLDRKKLPNQDIELVQIQVDDDIGEMVLSLPSEIYDEMQNEYHLKKGMIVLAEGKVFESKKSKEDTAIDILCWNVYPLSEKNKVQGE